MPFETRKISDHGTEDPLVARVGYQWVEILPWFNFLEGRRAAQVLPADGGSGASMFEVYDVLREARGPFLANLSARSNIAAGGSVTAGIAVTGPQSATTRVLCRASGAGLRNFGITGALDDVKLEVFDRNGRIIASNDNYDSRDPRLSSAAARAGAAPFLASKDAALLLDLPPGNFSVRVGSANGSTGVAPTEIFEVP